MTATASVVVDTTSFDRGVKKLADDLGRIDSGRRQAERTAGKIRAAVPVRTGALASTVDAVATLTGHGVTYGGGLRYAWPIEKRFHPVKNNLDSAAQEFHASVETAAAAVVHSL